MCFYHNNSNESCQICSSAPFHGGRFFEYNSGDLIINWQKKSNPKLLKFKLDFIIQIQSLTVFCSSSFFHFKTHKITNAFLVPPIVIFLAKSPLIAKYDLSSLQTIISGAAPVAKKMELLAKEKTNVKTVRQGYGMTECTYIVTCQNDNDHTNGSVGALAKGIHGRVVDIESGKFLGPNETGELHFKGKNLMKGYIGNVQATSATIDADGWLHTGDVGYYDENGEFYIVDRIKELIKYKAFQVPPAEIEALLLTHPKIKDAGVVGVSHEEGGEAAFAFVVKQPGAQITESDVILYVAGCLSKL